MKHGCAHAEVESVLQNALNVTLSNEHTKLFRHLRYYAIESYEMVSCFILDCNLDAQIWSRLGEVEGH